MIYNNSVVSKLYGNYTATGYTLSDFTIVGSDTKVGFFGEVTGEITGVDLRYVTVLSSGANASVGAIAAVANTIENSTAQGHIYTSNNSTVGFLAGEANGAVTGSAAVGYVQVSGGTVTVGGAVGKANANVTADTFVEVNELATANITAGGIVGSTVGEITVSGAYLEGSLGGADGTVAGGTATAYAEYLPANATIRNMVIGYVMKNFYVGTIYAEETLTYTYEIKNYRQLVIMEMYSWATYNLGANIELPYSYGNSVHAGEFAYGSGINENGKKIYSSAAGTFMGVEEVVR